MSRFARARFAVILQARPGSLSNPPKSFKVYFCSLFGPLALSGSSVVDLRFPLRGFREPSGQIAIDFFPFTSVASIAGVVQCRSLA